MTSYPYSVENGSGETLTFLRLIREPDGDRLEAEIRATPKAGPPMHVHRLQEEAMTVKVGRLGYQVLGEPPRFSGAGESAVFPPGVAHKWWNAGDTELVCTGYIKPADNAEFFLSAIFESMKRSGRGRPGIFDAAFLLTRYQSEFGMLEIPALVQKFLFPIAVVLGDLLGTYEKFDAAPEPVQRKGGSSQRLSTQEPV